jgi:hypothetical protein
MEVEGRVKVIDRTHLPEGFREYRKVETTQAVRVSGQVKVVTREGIMSVKDPWIAIDANGWPYPIADDVFQKSYEAVEPSIESSLDE